jgi:hypothetical protein
MSSFAPKSGQEFSTCIGVSIVTSSHSKTSSCRLSAKSRDYRWIKLAELIPWDELKDDYAMQLHKGVETLAKPF